MRAPPEEIIIDTYRPEYATAFRQLNEEWITAYFELEGPDVRVLGDPQGEIIARSGMIFVALVAGVPRGVCALIKENDDTYELAKMAVSPLAQGRGLGWRLGVAALQYAKERGAKRVELVGNTRMAPSIRLYRKLGFQEFAGDLSAYQRGNILMEILL